MNATRANGSRIRTDGEVACFDPGGQWLASFTVGAQTVLLRGPARRFREGRHGVRHSAWVRLLPAPFDAQRFDGQWLADALVANGTRAPDVLAIAMEYLGDVASYGPRIGDTREEGADFNDYLGIAWEYPGEQVDAPEARQRGCMDCSGYMRMVYGYRGGLALCLASREDRSALPRRARQMATHAPGVAIARDRVLPGDLVFFDADPDDGPRVDHVGLYLGRDTQGERRFLSSRKRADGPTMGDVGGKSILDGPGLYARAYKRARRL